LRGDSHSRSDRRAQSIPVRSLDRRRLLRAGTVLEFA